MINQFFYATDGGQNVGLTVLSIGLAVLFIKFRCLMPTLRLLRLVVVCGWSLAILVLKKLWTLSLLLLALACCFTSPWIGVLWLFCLINWRRTEADREEDQSENFLDLIWTVLFLTAIWPRSDGERQR